MILINFKDLKSFFLKIFLGAFLVLVLYNCRSTKEQNVKPSRSISNPDSDLLEVNAIAFHNTDTTTIVFAEVINENLVYKRPDTSSAFYAEVKLSYRLLPEAGSDKVLSAGEIYLNDRAGEDIQVKSLRSMLFVDCRSGNDYYLELKAYDMNKKVFYVKGLTIQKKNAFTRQSFLLNVNGQVAFTNRFSQGEKVELKYTNSKVSQLKLDCFTKDFPPAWPPFSDKVPDVMKYKPDSSYHVSLVNGESSVVIPQNGFFHLRVPESELEGLTLYSNDKTFPGVGNVEEMIRCTRYIMNRDEYDSCMMAHDRKAAIDAFWLEIGGSSERAKELIRRYYGRVKEANKYYSSYVPGWKTDRGMIFIIYGKPNYVHHMSRHEIWVYGMESNPNALRFTFLKAKNPFSDNDFLLDRSPFYKDSWYNAVDTWREGHVYLEGRK